MAVFALFGSGEFLPWAREVDRWAAEQATAGSDRVLILPTASAPEGDDVFNRWAGMGAEHFAALGLTPEVLPLKTREDAFRAEIVDEVADARYVFFSGGNPGYLAETLRETPFWEALRDALAHGTAFGGCSAGASAVGSIAPDVTSSTINLDDLRWVPGLPLFTRASIPTHFDAVDTFFPGLRRFIIDARPADNVLFGIDEDTAACGDGTTWTVHGNRAVTIVGEDGGEPVEHFAGETVACPLGLTLGSRF
jgi:cyanophycinase